MQVSRHWCRWALRAKRTRRATPVVLLALAFALAVSLAPSWSHAQTLTVLHFFTGGADGGYPSGVTMDRFGNIYGTTAVGGSDGWGTVYKLSHVGSGWVLLPLYDPKGGADQSYAPPIMGPDGTLYGIDGGGLHCTTSYYCGEVYRLTPPPSVCRSVMCGWNKTVVYQFSGSPDGWWPSSNVNFDHSGNLYGTTSSGGAYGYGTVYQLRPSGSGWTEQILYSFTGASDGASPFDLVIDAKGNLYGVTDSGGAYGYGNIFQLSPSEGGWTESTLYSFNDVYDGGAPGGLVIDTAANLYGISQAYSCCCGLGNSPGLQTFDTIFAISPFEGGWWFRVIGNYIGRCSASVSMGTDDNIYVLASTPGILFKVANVNGAWTVTMMYSFGNTPNGSSPGGNVVADPAGHVYGTLASGGLYGDGSLWQITP